MYNTAFVIFTLGWGTVNKLQLFFLLWHFFGFQLLAQNNVHACHCGSHYGGVKSHKCSSGHAINFQMVNNGCRWKRMGGKKQWLFGGTYNCSTNGSIISYTLLLVNNGISIVGFIKILLWNQELHCFQVCPKTFQHELVQHERVVPLSSTALRSQLAIRQFVV